MIGSPTRTRTARAAALLALPALLAAGSAPARAQAGPLDGYVREALQGNLGLRQQRMADARSEAQVRQARGLYLPTVTVDARYSRTSGVLDLGDLVNPAYEALNRLTRSDAFPTDVDARLPLAQETKVRVAQPLFQPAVRAGHQVARSLRGLQGAQLRAATRQLAAEVQAAYLGHAKAVRVVELYRATLPLLAENVRVNERLVAAGRATSEGVFRARAERSETEQRLAEAEELRDAAARGFNFLLGRPLDAAVEALPDSLLRFPAEVPLDSALASARRHREELAQAEFGIRAAEAQGRLARSAYLPGVSLAVDYGVQGNRYRFGTDDDFAVASLVLQWNVFNGGQDAARSQAARLEADRARTQRVELERRVEMQVRQAHDALRTAGAARAAADARLAAARRTWELVSRRWEEGIAPHVEFVDARTAYTAAGLNAVLTRYDHALRYVELERAAALRVLEP